MLGTLIAVLRRKFPPMLTISQIYEGLKVARQLEIEDDIITEGEGKKKFRTGQKDVGSAGTPVQITEASVPVSAGRRVTVVAKPGNAGVIYFGNEDDIKDSGRYFDGLAAGLAHSFDISNVNLIWVDASADGDGVSWYVEQ